MAKPSDQPGFWQLLEDWNQKLYDSGFRDIEKTSKAGPILKRSGTVGRYEQMDEISREARIDYFEKVSTQVSRADFKDEFERQVLTLYAQGVSQADIYRRLEVSGHRCIVYEPIYRWLKIWGLK